MRNLFRILTRILLLAFCLFVAESGVAQGYDDPLTMQGVDHTTLQSAASRATGGTVFGIRDDAGIMFANPAALQTLNGIQLSIGGLQQYEKSRQIQQYTPLKYYSNFSLLMEGLTGYISDPTTIVANPNAGDTVQRAFDNIGPNWARSASRGKPIQVILAVPFALGKYRFAAGIGAVEYANLDHYYQNNNVLSPSVGSERPLPLELPRNDSTPVPVQWYQYLRSRDGTIRGYGAAVSGVLTDQIALGISGMVLSGSSNDYEQHVGRGTLVFYTNYFRLDRVDDQVSASGSSKYKGFELTVSGNLRSRYLTLGFAVKPPTTITREYTSLMQSENGGSRTSATVNGTDKVKLPWRGTVGLAIAVADNLNLGLEYEIRAYSSAVYTADDGSTSNPWLTASLLHVGADYSPLPWLTVRGGARGQGEVFQQTGNPLPGDAVVYTIYSAGVGVRYAGARLNVTYEYAPMKYQDLWQTNVSLNNDTRHLFIADIAYELP